MANKHHHIQPVRRKRSWLSRVWCAAIASAVSLLGFSSCASSRKAKQAEPAPDPTNVRPPLDPTRPRLLYGVPPVQYRENIPTPPEAE